MNITLGKRQGMWFLGTPQKIKLSLNINSPGPVEVNFDNLSVEEQKQMLLAIKAGKITSDTSFDSLYKVYTKRQQKEAPPPPQEVQKYLEKQEKAKLVKKELSLQAKQEARDKEIEERAQYLSKQSIRAIKASVKKETDVKLLRRLLELEQSKRKRLGVIDALKGKITKFQTEVSSRIKSSTSTTKYTPPEATFPGDVVESDTEEVVLSEENLRNLAAGKGISGGD